MDISRKKKKTHTHKQATGLEWINAKDSDQKRDNNKKKKGYQ